MSSDLTSKDYEGYKQNMLQGLKDGVPEYTDFSDYDPGVTIIQALAYALDGLSYYQERAVNELSMDTAVKVESAIRIANQYDYATAGYVPAEFEQVFEILPQSTPYTIYKGYRVTTDEVNTQDRQVYELEDDLTIPANCTGLEQDTNGNFLYAVSVIHGVSISDVLLGTSTGATYQTFRIDDIHIIDSSIEVYVNEGQGFVKWGSVDNFVSSFASDLVYKVIFDGKYYYIQFGSGVLGHIPSVFVNGIKVNYRVGGGVIGNVGANTITQMASPLAIVVQTFNPQVAFVKGTDMDTIDDIKQKSIAKLRAKDRAVTLQDFEDIAREQLEYVLRIQANHVGNDITLYVLTTDDPITGLISAPTQTLLQNFYDDRRMINDVVSIANPTFLSCDLSITLWVLDNFVAVDTENAVLTYLNDKFTLGNYDFGEELIKSFLIKDIMNIAGVKAVDITVTSNGGQTLPASNQIVKLGAVTWDLRGGI